MIQVITTRIRSVRINLKYYFWVQVACILFIQRSESQNLIEFGSTEMKYWK
jgi:hypothetical protein